MKVFISGTAGFIGSHLVEHLLKEGHQLIGWDNFDPLYARQLKEHNLSQALNHPQMSFVEADLLDQPQLISTIKDFRPDVIVHLAAKAGVQPSLQDPAGYQQTNVQGTQNLLEAAKQASVKQFVFASSSSVYGVNPNVPWHEDDHVLHPISPYAATKVAGELMGHVYSHLYGIRFVALRFFTVYGPRQRPDLAICKFAKRLLKGESIAIYGDGSTRRDYTYIADIVQGVRSAMDYEGSIYEVINLGHHHPVTLHDLVDAIENTFELKFQRTYESEKPGDVPQTYASIDKARKLLNYEPQTKLEDGLASFKQWLLSQEIHVK